MFDSSGSEDFVVGDRVAWWEAPGGRGAEPDQPGAHRYAGTVTHVWRNAAGTVVAYFVDVVTTVGGAWNATVRPDLGHRLVPRFQPDRNQS